MSSGSPSSQASNPGAARMALKRMASWNRSLAGKKESRSMTPTRLKGGSWIARIRPGKSRPLPPDQAV